MNEKIKKKYPIRRNTDSWDLAALRLRASFAPPAYECQKCGAPVVSNFCCNFCGDSRPYEKEELI